MVTECSAQKDDKMSMQWILTCDNGKKIDMSHYILLQMQGDITREDVLNRIKYYKKTNKK